MTHAPVASKPEQAEKKEEENLMSRKAPPMSLIADHTCMLHAWGFSICSASSTTAYAWAVNQWF
jgi:hypothetical protein